MQHSFDMLFANWWFNSRGRISFHISRKAHHH